MKKDINKLMQEWIECREAGKTKLKINQLIGINSNHYVSFSMWAEKHQKEFIEKKEKNYFSSGYYRGFTSGLFETEHDNTIQENILILIPHYFKAMEEAEKNPPKQTRRERKIQEGYKSAITNNYYEEQNLFSEPKQKAPTMKSNIKKYKKGRKW